ncbi:type IV pilus modification protein PilV [Pseudocolwellia agarivorans]|uniref:type IV pilus modification protein PilV n=1 Tax=Pseudocolwellia agarivorans TaxID=1911682 RepID=UPI000984AC81|nr:type IV pilus modification protein PilV [Pseudocolwellia agarivorans]
MRLYNSRPYKQCRLKKTSFMGMTLIEVLVALFILSTGILGAVAMQASAKKGSFDAMQRSMASSLAQNIIERMRGNDATVGLNVLDGYNGTYGVTPLTAPAVRCDRPTALCNAAELTANDLYEWEQSLIGKDVQNLSKGNGGLTGVVACIEHVNNAVSVAISWEGREETSDGAKFNTTFGSGCGTTSTKRRQIVVDAFIF